MTLTRNPVNTSWKSKRVFMTNDAVPGVLEQLTTRIERAPIHREKSTSVNKNENQLAASVLNPAIQ